MATAAVEMVHQRPDSSARPKQASRRRTEYLGAARLRRVEDGEKDTNHPWQVRAAGARERSALHPIKAGGRSSAGG